MSVFVPLRRATLLIPSGPPQDPDRRHLFVLMCNPVRTAAGALEVALVSISSIKPGLPFDATCVLEPGEHAFIARRSFVLYRLARIEPADKLLRGVKAGVLTPHEPMAQQPFERIAQGWMRSPHTPQGLRAWWRQYVS